jgi:tRNA(Ile)-lysidine synthetase-like protein
MYRDMVARGRSKRARPRRRHVTGATTLVREAARAEAARGRPLVLAVSGGRDSMVLLEALVRVAPDRVAAVATFDHGTGAAATGAAALVCQHASALGMSVRSGASRRVAHTEAEWRSQRMEFLGGVARELDARIVTAHTLDDHLETVLMRVLRGSGARGLAGLLAPSSIGRPFVTIARETVAACAAAWSVPFVSDPTNLSREHLRNRVRMDLLPALVRVRPGLPHELLDLSRRAADVRAALERWIDEHVALETRDATLVVGWNTLVELDSASLAVVWPAIAARQGVTLDRRGTERLVSFTIQGVSGRRIQLSGGAEVIRQRDRLLLRRVPVDAGSRDVTPLAHETTWGDWRFSRTTKVTDRWTAELSTDRPLGVRGWRPGDRMIPEGSTEPRRLKGLFRDARVDAARRRAWPVVVAGEEIVWVPGVRRALAAPARSGRPNVTFRCEHIDR